MQFLIVLLLTLGCFASAHADCQAEQAGWVKAKQSDGVTVSTRQLPDKPVEVCAYTAVRTGLGAFILLLRDTDQAPQWIANANTVTVLARPDATTDLVHSVFDAPWPIQDRDLVTRSRYHQDPTSLILTLDVEDASEYLATLPATVRMRSVKGRWQLTPLNEGWVAILYQGQADPGGNIPQWLSQKLVVSSTFETFVNLSKILLSPAYQNKPVNDIKELAHSTQNSEAIPKF